MIKLKVNLLNFEKFREDFQTKRGRYSFLLSLSNIALLLALGIFINNLYLNNAVASLVGFMLLFLSLMFQCFFDFNDVRLYKGIIRLLDSLNEDNLYYNIKSNILSIGTSIVKGLNYKIVEGSCNQLRDSYENGKYKLILEICHKTSKA